MATVDEWTITVNAAEYHALIRRVERYEKALWYIVRRGYTGAQYVAREALKEETDSVG